MEFETNRPKLLRPRIQTYKADEDELAELLDFISKKVLNHNEYKFYVRSLNKEVSFNDILENTKSTNPSNMWIEILRVAFSTIPERLRLTNQELFTVMKRFTLNLQERINYESELESYCDELESRIKELEDIEENSDNDTKNETNDDEIKLLNEKVSVFLEIIESLKKDIDELKKKDRKEVSKESKFSVDGD
jgi:hypothetical protein